MLLGKFAHKRGKDLLLMVGMLVHFTAFYLIFLNLPADSPLHPTDQSSFIGPKFVILMCN